MLISSRLLMLTLLQCILLSYVSPAHAARLKCAGFPVAFEYEKSGEIKCVCKTARATITFLKTLGLETTEVITIRLVEHFSHHQRHNLVGFYNLNSQKIELLTYQKTVELLQKNKSALASDISEEIWCSYAAHELAHAISSQYLSPKVKKHIAGEYISAVTQLTVLTPESRKKILKRYQDIGAYKSKNEMSIYYFLSAPNKFAVKCYLHFMSLDKPKEFTQRFVNDENVGGEGY